MRDCSAVRLCRSFVEELVCNDPGDAITPEATASSSTSDENGSVGNGHGRTSAVAVSGDEPVPICCGCKQLISDKFLLQIQHSIWHMSCVRCCECNEILINKCYTRDEKLFCRDDFFKRYAKKCNGCHGTLSADESVRKAHELVYHVRCFVCHMCEKQFRTGDEFYLTNDRRILCRQDYEAAKYNDLELESSNKRPRTTITAKQLERLKQAYSTSPKPARHIREKLSNETGLDMRVVQVWFQNRRAKEKRLRRDGNSRGLMGYMDVETMARWPVGRGSMPVIPPHSVASDDQAARQMLHEELTAAQIPLFKASAATSTAVSSAADVRSFSVARANQIDAMTSRIPAIALQQLAAAGVPDVSGSHDELSCPTTNGSGGTVATANSLQMHSAVDLRELHDLHSHITSQPPAPPPPALMAEPLEDDLTATAASKVSASNSRHSDSTTVDDARSMLAYFFMSQQNPMVAVGRPIEPELELSAASANQIDPAANTTGELHTLDDSLVHL